MFSSILLLVLIPSTFSAIVTRPKPPVDVDTTTPTTTTTATTTHTTTGAPIGEEETTSRTTTKETLTTSDSCTDRYPDACPAWDTYRDFCNSHYYTPADKYFYCAKTCKFC